MASAAMPLAELERWLQARVDRHPAATSIPMLDGYAAAIVAGPVSMSPLGWICPLLAIDADAFNHGGTPEFAAISAVALRHNEISNTLSTAPDRFEPMHRREVNGDIDPRPWCQGFYAAMQLRPSAWAPLLDAGNVNHGLLLPILLHGRDDQSRPPLGSPQGGRNAYAEIPAAVEALRQYWMPIRYPRTR
nr:MULTISPECIES: YecA family protein [Bradyrhizobium]